MANLNKRHGGTLCNTPIDEHCVMVYDVTIPSGTATTQRTESCDGRAEDESDIPSIISPFSVDILNRKKKRPGQRTTADRGKEPPEQPRTGGTCIIADPPHK